MQTHRPTVTDPEQPNAPIEPEVPYQPTEPDEPDVQQPITAEQNGGIGLDKELINANRVLESAQTPYDKSANDNNEHKQAENPAKLEQPDAITGADELRPEPQYSDTQDPYLGPDAGVQGGKVEQAGMRNGNSH